MTIVRDFIAKLAGTFGIESGGTSGEDAANAVFDVMVVQPLGPFEADDNTNVHFLWKNDTGYDLVLEEAELMPSVAVTADNTNYSTIAIAFGTVGAFVAAVTTLTTQITGTGNWVADTPEPFTVLTSSEANVLETGEYVKLTYDGTNGTGVDLPRCCAILRFRRK